MKYKILFRQNKHESWKRSIVFIDAYNMKEFIIKLEQIETPLEIKLIRLDK